MYYLLGNNEIAQDLSQEVFIKYYDNISNIEHISAWLLKVSTNMAFNYMKGQKIIQKKNEFILEDTNAIFSVEDIVITNEQTKKVREILSNLPEKQRVCLMLKFCGYSYEEISISTNIPKHSIGQMIARGKEKFLKLYNKEGDQGVS